MLEADLRPEEIHEVSLLLGSGRKNEQKSLYGLGVGHPHPQPLIIPDSPSPKPAPWWKGYSWNMYEWTWKMYEFWQNPWFFVTDKYRGFPGSFCDHVRTWMQSLLLLNSICKALPCSCWCGQPTRTCRRWVVANIAQHWEATYIFNRTTSCIDRTTLIWVSLRDPKQQSRFPSQQSLMFIQLCILLAIYQL
jgi:hypothetical protein